MLQGSITQRPGQSSPPLHCFLSPGLLLTPSNIHEPLKTNCSYWALCVLHSLVPLHRVVDAKEGEDVLNIIHSSLAALLSPQSLLQEESVALSLSMATMALTFSGCLCWVLSSDRNTLLTQHSFKVLVTVRLNPGVVSPNLTQFGTSLKTHTHDYKLKKSIQDFGKNSGRVWKP